MKIPFVSLRREANLIKNQLLKSTEKVIDSGNYIMGKNLVEFENRFASYVGVKYALGLGNGSDALTLIMRSLDLKSNDEVICPANSFIATAWAIIAAGAKPIFCDVEDDLLISLRHIKNVITKNTKAVIPVHLSGRICEMNKINKYCSERNIYVIEDAAQAIGGKELSNFAGSLGIAAGFSLHPLKNLSIYGDGGVLTTNNTEIYKKAKLLRNHGLRDRDNCSLWGFNTRLDELQASYALIKMDYLEEWTEKYISIARKYSEELDENIKKPIIRTSSKDVYHNYIITLDEDIREAFMKKLLDLGVETKIHYPIPLHLQKCSEKMGYKVGSLPNSERLSKSIVSLPIYHTLKEEEVDYVIKSVNTTFNDLQVK